MMLYAHRMAQAFEKHGIPKDDAQFEAAEIYRHATGTMCAASSSL